MPFENAGMKSHSVKKIAAAACAVLLPLLPAGCGGSSSVKTVNDAAWVAKPSGTDATSRLLARKSLAMLTERTEDYRVGPEDLLEVSIFEWELREETKSASFRVAESGFISLPVMGDLYVSGRTVGEIKKIIEKTLTDGGFIRQPRVSVVIKEHRSKRVAVVGSVNEPGVYTLRQNVTTLLDIISLAGGLSDKAGQILYVIRTRKPRALEELGKKAPREVANIDLHELMELGDLTLNMVLHNGDVVHVPEAKVFSVIGYVRKPGSFPIRKPTTILEGIALAGGLMEREASPEITILKRKTDEGSSETEINLTAVAEGIEPNLYLQADDVIQVRQDGGKAFLIETLDVFKEVINVTFIP